MYHLLCQSVKAVDAQGFLSSKEHVRLSGKSLFERTCPSGTSRRIASRISQSTVSSDPEAFEYVVPECQENIYQVYKVGLPIF